MTFEVIASIYTTKTTWLSLRTDELEAAPGCTGHRMLDEEPALVKTSLLLVNCCFVGCCLQQQYCTRLLINAQLVASHLLYRPTSFP